MTTIVEQLKEQEKAIKRIRNKKNGKFNTEKVRRTLNIAFLIIAAFGCLLYFIQPENRIPGLATIAVGMVFKVVEIFLRIML